MRKIEFEATEENILNIISRVKELELENGLSEEEIRKKYMNKDSGALALLIKTFLPDSCMSLFSDGEYDYYCISIKGDITKDDKLNSNYPQSKYYYNINGRHYYYDLINDINNSLGLEDNYMTLVGDNMIGSAEDNSTTLRIKKEILGNTDTKNIKM